MKNKVCCFTGHRPKSLPWGYNEYAGECQMLKNKLFFEIESTIQKGYNYFIIGMAQGIDTYVGELLIDFKKNDTEITIEAAIPCLNQDEKWLNPAKQQYRNILSWCDKSTVISEQYTPFCMQKRNQYMVDQSSRLIAVWNGKPSGTLNTIKYAKKKGIEVVIIEV